MTRRTLLWLCFAHFTVRLCNSFSTLEMCSTLKKHTRRFNNTIWCVCGFIPDKPVLSVQRSLFKKNNYVLVWTLMQTCTWYDFWMSTCHFAFFLVNFLFADMIIINFSVRIQLQCTWKQLLYHMRTARWHFSRCVPTVNGLLILHVQSCGSILFILIWGDGALMYCWSNQKTP